MDIRYFIEYYDSTLDDPYVYMEVSRVAWESVSQLHTIEYARHTVFENGVSQVCLTKVLED